MQTSSKEKIKMKNKVYNQQPKHPKLILNAHFSPFGETRMASSMKTLKLKALWYKHEKMLIHFFESLLEHRNIVPWKSKHLVLSDIGQGKPVKM